MNDFTTSLRGVVIVLWHVVLFITGIAMLAIWLVAWWLERAIAKGHPRLVAALPEKYHPVLLALAAFTVKPRNRDDR